VAATKYLLRLKKNEGTLDDIDHLGSRRVRTVGELLANQCRVGLARTERLVKERMTLFDQGIESMSPQKLINPKALVSGDSRLFRAEPAFTVHGPDQSAC
jgi:DNA-directed RNA polymerase subunit beta